MLKALKASIAMMALGATVIGGLAATPALARDHDRGRYDNHRDRDRGRHGSHGKHWNQRGRDRVVVIRERRAPPRVVYAYDWNRPDPRYGGYYAERYYRGGYAPVRVTRQTRIYRGYDNRYYCRRSDGTTGLIVGTAVGGLLGDRIDRGRSSILGAVIGAGAGALIGKEIDSGQVQCR